MANVTIIDNNGNSCNNVTIYSVMSILCRFFDVVAVIGFLSTMVTTVEGSNNNWLNFSIGVIRGYLDISVTINFTTEDVTAQGTTNTG